MQLPWPSIGVSRFDMASNLFGYMPLGALLFVAAWRHGVRALPAAAAAIAIGALLSFSMEVMQNFLRDACLRCSTSR